MIYKSIVILLTVLISNQTSYSADIIGDNNKVEITYIANEGFLIEVNDKTILIDALFGDREYGFCDIPDSSQIELMRNGKGDFEDIDLIAATHSHIDHFYAPFVIDHLSNNKNGKFISCQQSINNIKKTENYYAGIESQLVEITPDSLIYKDTLINGIEVRVFRMIHGPYYVDDPKTGKRINRHQNIQNLGFLFNINGTKIFHCGDSGPACKSDYEHFKLDQENIDVAFLGAGFMWSTDCDGIEILRKYINPKHIVLMHIHHDQNKRFIDVAEEMKDEFPSVMVFESSMEMKNYTAQ